MATKKKAAPKTKITKYIKWFWITFLAGFGGVLFIFLLASWGALGEMPTFEQLENPKTNLATQVIASDNVVLGKYYQGDNRTPVDYDDLPENLIQALVATEDERYYEHSGIDARGFLRALANFGRKGGASTITQQLARQLFVGVRSKNLYEAGTQKIKEWVIATRLERNYTKEEIIAMYMNIYDFNYAADGIQSAASIYFGGKKPRDLKVEESAVLVGMLKNSSYYDPFRRPELVRDRRNTVFAQMARNGYITEAEKDSLKSLPMEFDYTPQSHRVGLATYFRAYIQDFMKQWVKDNPKADGTKYNIYKDGLKIYTTIDSRMQAYAEEATKEHMKRLQAEFFVQNTKGQNPTAPFLDIERSDVEKIVRQAMRRSERWKKMKARGVSEKKIEASFKEKAEMTVFSWEGEIDTIMTPRDSILYYKHFLRSGMMSMDPQTGHVKAWVGGYDYKHFQYDHVRQGKRQVGSTFKPFVYATAIDQLHLSPCDSLPNIQHCIEAGKYGNMEAWCPKNTNGKYGGQRTLKNALANSINTITARLMDQVGPAPVVNLARKMGITSPDLLEVPSIALGTPDINLFEMVGAYSTFANYGIYQKPVMVTRIEDKNGTVLYEFIPETKDVLSKESAYVTLNLMQGVTQTGSGMRLRHSWATKQALYKDVMTGYPYAFENPIAGKTGTTQNNSDGWFMGMVPNLVTGVWVGGEDRATHFKTTLYGQGASMALPIWGLYMKKCYADESLGISKEDFRKPDNLSIKVDCSKIDEDSLQDNDDEDDLEDLGF